VADGYQLLNELGAVDEMNDLTKMGWELAKLPLDPRVALLGDTGRIEEYRAENLQEILSLFS